jgi:hypothetical protein
VIGLAAERSSLHAKRDGKGVVLRLSVCLQVTGDTEEMRELCQGLGVTRLPTFLLYKDHKIVSQFCANLTKVNLLRAEIAAHKECS